MVLKSLLIEDFLSIRGKIELAIDPRVTILLGANDHGKSNILRALGCLNGESPITDEDRNWDADGEPRLAFRFEMTIDEQRRLVRMLSELHHSYREQANSTARRREETGDTEEEREESDGEEPVVSIVSAGSPGSLKEDTKQSSTTSAIIKRPIAKAEMDGQGDQDTDFILEDAFVQAQRFLELLVRYQDSDTIEFDRRGVGSPLAFEGEPLAQWGL